MLKKVPVSHLSHQIGLVSGEPLGLSDDARVQRRPYVERAPYSERRQCNKEVDVCLSDWGAVVRNVDLRDVVSAIH